MGITIFQTVPTLYGSNPADVGTVAATGASGVASPGDHAHKLADTGWLTPALLNGWVVYDATYGNAAMYRKIGNIVFVRGLIKNGTVGTNMFILPAGYRPGIRLLFAAETNSNVLCRIDVDSTGYILGTGESNAWVSLNNIMFVADN